MIKIKPVILIVVALTFLSDITLLYAQRRDSGIDPPAFERVGQSGWQFLHLPSVARNAALADVKIGLSNNSVTAIFSNPAKLVDIGNIDVSFTKINYVADISYISAAVAKNFGMWGVFGIHVANLDVGDMIRTENILDERFDITYRSGDIETFTAGDILAGLSYARSVTDRLSVGGNFSYIKETLDQTEVDNWSADFGIFFSTGFNSLTLSMVARNIGPDAEFTGFDEIYGLPQSVRMPVNFRLGVGYDVIEPSNGSNHKLSTFLEGVHPNDGPERVHAAFEYNFIDVLFLRGGYKFNYDEQGITLGGGINYNMKGVTGRIDYAYLDYGRLSSVHLFTLGFAIED
jgi:hypothetical protein